MMSTTRRGGAVGLVAIAGVAMAAPAGVDTITFDELAAGTEIHGQTLLGYATFSTQAPAIASPTVEVEGVPNPSDYGEGAFLIGELGDVVSIDLAIPVTFVSMDWTLNDTVHSSAQLHMIAFDALGGTAGFVQSFPEITDTWPAIMGDNIAGTIVMEGVGEIVRVELWFAATSPLSDTFAFDNVTFESVRCNAADLAEPFGAIDFSDVIAFLGAFGAQSPLADLAAPFGTWDFNDVIEFLSAFGAGCP